MKSGAWPDLHLLLRRRQSSLPYTDGIPASRYVRVPSLPRATPATMLLLLVYYPSETTIQSLHSTARAQ